MLSQAACGKERGERLVCRLENLSDLFSSYRKGQHTGRFSQQRSPVPLPKPEWANSLHGMLLAHLLLSVAFAIKRYSFTSSSNNRGKRLITTFFKNTMQFSENRPVPLFASLFQCIRRRPLPFFLSSLLVSFPPLFYLFFLLFWWEVLLVASPEIGILWVST